MFLHTFAFLFVRFRPSAYQCVLSALARNLACATVPTIVDEALQLLCLAVVIGSCVLVSVRLLPWRITVAKALDITTNVGFLVILFLAALCARLAHAHRGFLGRLHALRPYLPESSAQGKLAERTDVSIFSCAITSSVE